MSTIRDSDWQKQQTNKQTEMIPTTATDMFRVRDNYGQMKTDFNMK